MRFYEGPLEAGSSEFNIMIADKDVAFSETEKAIKGSRLCHPKTTHFDTRFCADGI